MNSKPFSPTACPYFAGIVLFTFLTTQRGLVAQNITGNNVNVTGNVDADGWGWFRNNNIYVGPAQGNRFQLRWVPSGTDAGTMWSNIDRASGTFGWREDVDNTFENKMILEENNVLTLYKANGGVAGITLNPGTGRIDINGTAPGIYFGATPIVTASAGATTISTNSLTVVGDSFVNGIRIGKGGGNVASNAAFGSSALGANSSGHSNSAFGTNTLTYNTTGSWNTAYGSAALMSNTTGICNVAVGVLALSRNTTGNTNVAIGLSAGEYLADGASYLTSATSSIFIGANTKAASATTDNTIVIGKDAVSKGSNTTVIGNSSTTETHLMGAVILAAPQGDISMGDYAN